MVTILANVPLASETTFRVGGVATAYAVAHSPHDLVGCVRYAKDHGFPLFVLGGGSNVLIDDAGVKGLVVKMAIEGTSYEADGNLVTVTAGAGMQLDHLILETVARGLWGLENLSHIPGTVGATPIQNVGAYGVEVAELIERVEAYDTKTESIVTLRKDECAFSYRHSLFKTDAGKHLIVTSVTFALSAAPQPRLTYKDMAERFAHTPSLLEIREAVIDIRSKKFPDWNAVGTTGSFFKNPIITKEHYETLLQKYPQLPAYSHDGAHVKVPLGWILDKLCNLKGARVGDVGTYEGQSLVIVNYGGATSDAVAQFADTIEKKVFALTGITIEWEVTHVR